MRGLGGIDEPSLNLCEVATIKAQIQVRFVCQECLFADGPWFDSRRPRKGLQVICTAQATRQCNPPPTPTRSAGHWHSPSKVPQLTKYGIPTSTFCSHTSICSIWRFSHPGIACDHRHLAWLAEQHRSGLVPLSAGGDARILAAGCRVSLLSPLLLEAHAYIHHEIQCVDAICKSNIIRSRERGHCDWVQLTRQAYTPHHHREPRRQRHHTSH